MLTEQDKVRKILKETSNEVYERIKKELDEIAPFKAHENHFLTPEQKAVMVSESEKKFKELFDILKLDYLNDENIQDTPMRIASMWVNEWFKGRYASTPRIAAFPYEKNDNADTIISKKLKITSLCSHHFAPFFDVGNNRNSYTIVAYKPHNKVLGISKLQRIIDYYAKRPQLQETLTSQIFDHLSAELECSDVFVYLKNLEHTCESTRGVSNFSPSNGTSTLQFGGVFNDQSLRDIALEMSQ